MEKFLCPKCSEEMVDLKKDGFLWHKEPGKSCSILNMPSPTLLDKLKANYEPRKFGQGMGFGGFIDKSPQIKKTK